MAKMKAFLVTFVTRLRESGMLKDEKIAGLPVHKDTRLIDST